MLLGAAGALIALLLHEITDFNLQIPANAVLFAATAGALLGSLAAGRSRLRPRGRLPGLGGARRARPAG
jgi:hypothetical protein